MALMDNVWIIEIEEEFEALGSLDIYGEYRIEFAYDIFGDGDENKDYDRTFGFKKRSITVKYFNMQAPQKVETFLRELLDGRGILESAKIADICENKAVRIIHHFLLLCKEKGLPVKLDIPTLAPNGLGQYTVLRGWRRPTVKLNEAQVRMIKIYLSDGYSTYKVSKMYGISQSTIHLINRGMIWKHVVAYPSIRERINDHAFNFIEPAQNI